MRIIYLLLLSVLLFQNITAHNFKNFEITKYKSILTFKHKSDTIDFKDHIIEPVGAVSSTRLEGDFTLFMHKNLDSIALKSPLIKQVLQQYPTGLQVTFNSSGDILALRILLLGIYDYDDFSLTEKHFLTIYNAFRYLTIPISSDYKFGTMRITWYFPSPWSKRYQD